MQTHKLVITFDVKRSNERQALIEYLTAMDSIPITPTSYFFESPKDMDMLFKDISHILSSGEDIWYIFTVRHPWTGFGSADLNARLKTLQKENAI